MRLSSPPHIVRRATSNNTDGINMNRLLIAAAIALAFTACGDEVDDEQARCELTSYEWWQVNGQDAEWSGEYWDLNTDETGELHSVTFDVGEIIFSLEEGEGGWGVSYSGVNCDGDIVEANRVDNGQPVPEYVVAEYNPETGDYVTHFDVDVNRFVFTYRPVVPQ